MIRPASCPAVSRLPGLVATLAARASPTADSRRAASRFDLSAEGRRLTALGGTRTRARGVPPGQVSARPQAARRPPLRGQPRAATSTRDPNAEGRAADRSGWDSSPRRRRGAAPCLLRPRGHPGRVRTPARGRPSRLRRRGRSRRADHREAFAWTRPRSALSASGGARAGARRGTLRRPWLRGPGDHQSARTPYAGQHSASRFDSASAS